MSHADSFAGKTAFITGATVLPGDSGGTPSAAGLGRHLRTTVPRDRAARRSGACGIPICMEPVHDGHRLLS